jgi:hypothetical protein
LQAGLKYNAWNALITPYYDKIVSLGSLTVRLSPGVYFGLFTVMMVPVMIAFPVVVRRFNYTLRGCDCPCP